MKQICIFGGTTEGRELAEFLSPFPELKLTLCVATEYGETLLNHEHYTVKTGRMSEEEMKNFLPTMDFILDCTHPFATQVTSQLQAVCQEISRQYWRVIRESSPHHQKNTSNHVIYLESLAEIKEYLHSTSGNILSTIGSKELQQFASCSFLSRFYPRILPVASSLEACGNIGLPPSQIIAMQGPFSYEMNKATVESYKISIMLTKESGNIGGFEEKYRLAEDLGLTLLVWSKPVEELGYTLSEMKRKILEEFGLTLPKKLSVISCGVGDFTKKAEQALEGIPVVFGAKTLLERISLGEKQVITSYSAKDIAEFWLTHPEESHLALLVSGDCGFYSAGKSLATQLPETEIIYYEGISAPIALAARLQIPWEDAFFLSLHGKNAEILPTLRKHKKTFLLLGGDHSVESLCKLLLQYELNFLLQVGEDLGTPQEKITIGTAKELENQSFSSLSCCFVENPQPILCPPLGLPDHSFHRVETVPMTKAEVRAVILSKLQVSSDSIVYDLGAGTGSVSMELSYIAKKVYALEQKSLALKALSQNCLKFSADNVEIIEGDAEETISSLPAPTEVFIGGFSGKLSHIVEKILKKNPNTRIVASTVTLDTLSQLTALMSKFQYQEAIQLAVTRVEPRGKYQMLLANNPIFVFTFQNPKDA